MTSQLASTWKAIMGSPKNPLKYIAAKHSAANNRKMQPAPYLSSASKCVWQMDREA